MNESEVIEHTEALPDHYASRVRPEDLDGMRSMADGGEWQELVDLLIASLTLTQAPVTADERDELRSLAEAMDLPTGPLARWPDLTSRASGDHRASSRRPGRSRQPGGTRTPAPVYAAAYAFPVSVKGVAVQGGKAGCMVREIGEESGLTVTAGPLLDCWQYHIRAGSDVVIVTYGCHVGRRVWAFAGLGGGYVEQAIAPAGKILPLPANLSAAGAVTLGSSGAVDRAGEGDQDGPPGLRRHHRHRRRRCHAFFLRQAQPERPEPVRPADDSDLV